MKIEIPEDFQQQCEIVKAQQTEASIKMIEVFKSILPRGYKLECGADSIRICLMATDNKPAGVGTINDFYSIHRNSLVVVDRKPTTYSNKMTLSQNIGADDIYKLCPLMQLFASIDFTFLPIFDLVGE